MPTLKGKCALITGGGRGIGRAIAERLAADGAAVVIVDFNGTTASETARALSESGARAASLCADVANPEAAAEATALAVGTFDETVGTGDNHGANRMLAADMGVIVDLDTGRG